MNPEAILLLIAGMAVLIAGAEAVVRSASRLAAAVGMSPLVIGLTVVAFGTSLPELAISLRAGSTGAPDIAVGNVVGSNIFNLLLILGLSAVVAPLAVAQRLVHLDLLLLIVVSALLFVLGLDGRIGRLDGFVLFGGIVGYTVFVILQSLRESTEVRSKYEREFSRRPRRIAGNLLIVTLLVAGLAMLMAGSRWLVDGAVAVAEALGVSELVIALTIVAAGTSLPEVATSVVASIRGERDIAVGNVIGSSLFNVLAILGLSSIFAPDGLRVAPDLLRFDIPVMIAVSVICLPVFFTGHKIDRWEGALFLAYYACYTLYLFLNAARPEAAPAFNVALGIFVVSITVLRIGVLGIRFLRTRRA
jgi:cation:H+ antiporter